jgi:hypothetical protein
LPRAPSAQTPPVGQEGPPVRGLLSQPVLGAALNRRQFLLAMGVGLLGAACTRSGGVSSQAPPGSIEAITAGAAMLSVLGTGADATPMNPGKNRFGFVLISLQNQAIVGGSPQVWVAPDDRSPPTGPVAATWRPFTAYEKTGDRSPASPLPGVFTADIGMPTTGNWIVAVTIGQGSKRSAGTGILPISGGAVVAGLGTTAVSTPTPVATSTSKIEEICTRTPVDRMHYISLDKALRNGKPSVVCFSTPASVRKQAVRPGYRRADPRVREARPGSGQLHSRRGVPAGARSQAATGDARGPRPRVQGLEPGDRTVGGRHRQRGEDPVPVGRPGHGARDRGGTPAAALTMSRLK